MPRSKKYERSEALERAMHAFWLKGYSATSINDLVEQTKLNRFSLYKEFTNKDELYIESFRNYEHTVMERRMSSLEQSSEDVECLRSFFMDYIKGVKEGLKLDDQAISCLTVLNATEKIGREGKSRDIMIRILERMTKAFEVVLHRAIENEEIRKKIMCENMRYF